MQSKYRVAGPNVLSTVQCPGRFRASAHRFGGTCIATNSCGLCVDDVARYWAGVRSVRTCDRDLLRSQAIGAFMLRRRSGVSRLFIGDSVTFGIAASCLAVYMVDLTIGLCVAAIAIIASAGLAYVVKYLRGDVVV